MMIASAEKNSLQKSILVYTYPAGLVSTVRTGRQPPVCLKNPGPPSSIAVRAKPTISETAKVAYAFECAKICNPSRAGRLVNDQAIFTTQAAKKVAIAAVVERFQRSEEHTSELQSLR